MAYLSVSELATQEGVSRSTVRSWIGKGLPSEVSPRGEIMIDSDAAEEWLDDEFDEEDGDDQDDEDGDE